MHPRKLMMWRKSGELKRNKKLPPKGETLIISLYQQTNDSHGIEKIKAEIRHAHQLDRACVHDHTKNFARYLTTPVANGEAVGSKYLGTSISRAKSNQPTRTENHVNTG